MHVFFHVAREFQILRAGESVRDDGGFERNDGRAKIERDSYFGGNGKVGMFYHVFLPGGSEVGYVVERFFNFGKIGLFFFERFVFVFDQRFCRA